MKSREEYARLAEERLQQSGENSGYPVSDTYATQAVALAILSLAAPLADEATALLNPFLSHDDGTVPE